MDRAEDLGAGVHTIHLEAQGLQIRVLLVAMAAGQQMIFHLLAAVAQQQLVEPQHPLLLQVVMAALVLRPRLLDHRSPVLVVVVVAQTVRQEQVAQAVAQTEQLIQPQLEQL
jgi:hypothetical protein